MICSYFVRPSPYSIMNQPVYIVIAVQLNNLLAANKYSLSKLESLAHLGRNETLMNVRCYIYVWSSEHYMI